MSLISFFFSLYHRVVIRWLSTRGLPSPQRSEVHAHPWRGKTAGKLSRSGSRVACPDTLGSRRAVYVHFAQQFPTDRVNYCVFLLTLAHLSGVLFTALPLKPSLRRQRKFFLFLSFNRSVGWLSCLDALRQHSCACSQFFFSFISLVQNKRISRRKKSLYGKRRRDVCVLGGGVFLRHQCHNSAFHDVPTICPLFRCVFFRTPRRDVVPARKNFVAARSCVELTPFARS